MIAKTTKLSVIAILCSLAVFLAVHLVPSPTEAAPAVSGKKGKGKPASAGPRGKPGTITWLPATLELELLKGTSESVQLTLNSRVNLADLSVYVTPELEPFLSINTDGLGPLPPGELVNLLASFSVAGDTPPGDYSGSVQIRAAAGGKQRGRNVARPLPVLLHVVEASAAHIPDGPAAPSPERITGDEKGQEWIKDEVVALLDLDTVNAQETIRAIAAATGGVFLGSISETFTYQIQYEVENDAALQAKIEEVSGFAQVSAAVRNFIAQPPAAVPNDTGYASPWTETTPAGDNYHYEMVRAPTAWDTTTGDTSVIVAVIDGDIQKTHEDLDGNLGFKWPDFESGGDPSWVGHGTHVAGLIGAEGNNAQGVTGMNWNVQLQGYDLGYGSNTTTEAQAMMALAVNNGADIVNMSLQWIDNNQCGTPGTADTLLQVEQANAVLGQAILWARHVNRDVLWVFAAGNECRDVIYASPASLVDLYPQNTLAVADVMPTGQLASTSNFGNLVTVAAPGTFIKSTLPDTYGYMSGTSMAAPLVSGLAALLKADDSQRTAAKIKNCMRDSANVFGGPVPGHDFSIIDAPEALACTASSVWAKSLGGAGYDSGKAIAVDGDGNIHTAGLFTGTADFDPGPASFNLTSTDYYNIFVSKLDGEGNFLWAKALGVGSYYEYVFSITVDSAGNVYTTGFFMGTADFDPGPGTFNLTSAGDWDVFISKLDSNGNFVWAKSIGGQSILERGNGITVDSAGNLYLTGGFAGTVDFDPGPGTYNLTSSAFLDIFVCKFDVNGSLVWAKAMGGGEHTYYDLGFGVAVDNFGNVYTSGLFQGTGDFDPGPGTFLLTSEYSNLFVSKLDANGNFLWAKSLEWGETGNYDMGSKIALDAFGNVYTTGRFKDAGDFDPGPGTFTLSSSGGYDIFVSKLDTNGNFVWAKAMGGTDYDFATAIAVDAFGNVYTTGRFKGISDFDPGSGVFNLSAGDTDIFVSKLDANGNFLWAESLGGAFFDTGVGIAVDEAGSLYATGSFEGTAEFDLGLETFDLSSSGANDVFVIKFMDFSMF